MTLQKAISGGQFSRLTLGKVDDIEGQNVQLYSVSKLQIDDDDILF